MAPKETKKDRERRLKAAGELTATSDPTNGPIPQQQQQLQQQAATAKVSDKEAAKQPPT
jgi:hypothetical protein